MPIQILMPALSPTMTDGTVARWLKQEGDMVAPGDIVAEIETDKAMMEVEAVDEGVLGRILVAAGTEGVAVNTPIALLLEGGETASALTAASATVARADLAPRTAGLLDVQFGGLIVEFQTQPIFGTKGRSRPAAFRF